MNQTSTLPNPPRRRRGWLHLLQVLACLGLLLPCARSAPNVIIFYVDDLGWPDVCDQWTADLATMSGLGVQGATDLVTPNINTIATNGVRCLNGYVSCPVCSPSRAGLMTGRHQQRFGYEMNPGPNLEYNPIFGLPLTECTMGDRMKALGYATAWVGKSHLGALDQYHPVNRGFDTFFGFLEGHHDYCAEGNPGGLCYEYDAPPPPQVPPPPDPIQRAATPVDATHRPIVVNETDYLSTVFGREAAKRIHDHVTDHPAQPFFLYLPFNGVHEPRQATADLLNRTAHKFPGETLANYSIRHSLAAMLLGVDDAIGTVLAELNAHPGLMENTLIVFSSDNGAPPPDREDRNGSVSLPLKGNKSALYEGGIRVPYIVQWKDHLTPRVVMAPVSTMDVLPTCVAAAGAEIPAAWQLDGKNLLPLLSGATAQPPHPLMYWRVETGRADEMEPGPRALRQGNWKLIKPSWAANWELYDLSTYAGLRETENLADARPDKLQELIPLYEAWAATLPRPRWDYNDPDYVTPTFVLEDVRAGSTTAAVIAPEFLPGTNLAAWQDDAGRLWRGTMDLATGFPTGTPVQVDTGLAPPSVNNEGPQWGVSANGASLFYTKAGAGGRLQIWKNGSALTTSTTADSTGARVSQDAAAASVGMIFNRPAAVVAPETAPSTATALPNQAAVEQNGRWIPGSADVVYVRTGAPTQLARYSTATGTSVTLTSDSGSKTDAWAFIAPEHGGELCYACVVDRLGIAIYRDLHRGGGLFDRVATLALPAGAQARYLFQMKPLAGLRGFNGVSWFTCAAYQNNDAASPGASGIVMLGLGPDAAHRLPMPQPVTGHNDLCAEWKSLTLRLSDPAATGVASGPETVIGEREVFCYYTRTPVSGLPQLRRTRTGLMRPEAGEASGFTTLAHLRDYTPGATDTTTGQRMGGTETCALVAHEGRLFAALGSRGNDTAHASWSGVQILVKDTEVTPWRVDHTGLLSTLFSGHLSVEGMTELSFTRQGAVPLGAPVRHIVAGLVDIGTVGQFLASARTRTGPGQWEHSEVATTVDPSNPLCFAVHLDRDINDDGVTDPTPANQPPVGVERVYAGLSNGEIYRGVYDSVASGRIAWSPAASLSRNTVKLGPVTGLAEANGVLYAACSMRQDTAADPVTGGLYRLNDTGDTWSQLAPWPTPVPVFSANPRQLVMTSLTAVADPRGCPGEVLLAARSWPGAVELIDPLRSHAVTVELDVRDFFARLWQDDSVRSQDVSVGYTAFTPATDPVTGQRVHLLGVWIEKPGAVNTATQFLIRHLDGTWEAAGIPGANLHGTRCFAVSPFAPDAGAAFYIGGHDAGGQPAEDTAWIMRSTWTAWPPLYISKPNAQSVTLAWPAISPAWLLESSTNLTNWVEVPDKPARSLTGTSLHMNSTDLRNFFRLRKP